MRVCVSTLGAEYDVEQSHFINILGLASSRSFDCFFTM